MDPENMSATEEEAPTMGYPVFHTQNSLPQMQYIQPAPMPVLGSVEKMLFRCTCVFVMSWVLLDVIWVAMGIKFACCAGNGTRADL